MKYLLNREICREFNNFTSGEKPEEIIAAMNMCLCLIASSVSYDFSASLYFPFEMGNVLHLCFENEFKLLLLLFTVHERCIDFVYSRQRTIQNESV